MKTSSSLEPFRRPAHHCSIHACSAAPDLVVQLVGREQSVVQADRLTCHTHTHCCAGRSAGICTQDRSHGILDIVEPRHT
eukprot:g36546.t1